MANLEQGLVDAAVTHLRRRGLTVTWQAAARPDSAVDGQLEVTWDGGRHVFPAVAKVRITPAVVPLLRRSGGKLVITDHVSPKLADALSDVGLNYADASGNASLVAPGLLVRTEGRRPTSRPSPSAGLPFSTTGLPVTFALLVLSAEDARPTQRELSELSGVSLGSTNRVVQALRRLGYVSEDGTPMKRKKLVDRWTEAYLVLGEEMSPVQRFTSDRWASPQDVLPSLPDGVFVGSELAAHVDGLSIRPETALIYAWTKGRQDLLRAGRLRPAEDGWVRVREPFWQPGLLGRGHRLPDFLIRADLLAEGDPRPTWLAMNWSSDKIGTLAHRVTD